MVILFITSFTVCPCFFFYLCVFKFDALSWKKGVLYKFSILTNISFSFCQNLMELHSYIVYLKFHHVQLFFICAKLFYWKRVLNVFDFRFFVFFFYSQCKHFLISLRQFKIYVADQKPQTIISFFPIYTKLYYRKRGLNGKLKNKLYKC